MRQIGQVPSIEKLSLANTGVRGLEPLRRLRRLQLLIVPSNPVGDGELDYLKDVPIEAVFLEGTQVTDAGVARLQGTRTLREVRLGPTISPDAAALQRSIPGLRVTYREPGPPETPGTPRRIRFPFPRPPAPTPSPQGPLPPGTPANPDDF